MPMDFPHVKSLRDAAKLWKFRDIGDHESEESYRNALADHVEKSDLIESMEIRTGRGWDKWNDDENRETLLRGMPSIQDFKQKFFDKRD